MPKDIAITREHKWMRDRMIGLFKSQKGGKLEMRKDDLVALVNRVINLLFRSRKVSRRDRRIVREVLDQMISSKEIVRDGKFYRLAPELRKDVRTDAVQRYTNSRVRALAS